MCDTQVLYHGGAVWLAKNSDRDPGEPQAVVRVGAVRGDETPTLRATHIDIAQVPDRHAVILSKPVWIWGAEMGVNDCGVAIGNEAIFSRQRQSEPALLGMDLLRLGLERAATADEAVHVITTLLAAHGQGGPAGFEDKSFHYDSSFIVADPQGAFVLETSGREWVCRAVEDFDAISNTLTRGAIPQRWSAGCSDVAHFAEREDTWLTPHFGRAAERAELSRHCLARTAGQGQVGFADLARQLRRHAGEDDAKAWPDSRAPLAGSNRDLCMHAAGYIRRSQTTGSMIARLAPGDLRFAFTGTSSPCLSIFKPVAFDEHPYHVLSGTADTAPLWADHERVQRRALFDAAFREELRRRFAQAEAKVFAALEADPPDPVAADELAWQAQQVALDDCPQAPVYPGGRHGRYWRRQPLGAA